MWATEAVTNKEKTVDEILLQQIYNRGPKKVPEWKITVAVIEKMIRTPSGPRVAEHVRFLVKSKRQSWLIVLRMKRDGATQIAPQF